MVDLSKYHAKLIAESRKNLGELDESILTLAGAPDNRFARETAFRAAHSIKGGAAMFGFDRISALAGELEDILYRAMQNEIVVSESLLDAAKASHEVLSDLIDSLEMKVDLVDGFEQPALARLAACAR
jgi:two-component system, chemotaxis family, sensor kinase CheA